MLVHSFSRTKEWFEDYRSFAAMFDSVVEPGKAFKVARIKSVGLYLGWVTVTGEYGQEKRSDECPAGTVVARKCKHCGHHEIGIETEAGEFVPLRPGTHLHPMGSLPK